jgi:hypothetical protein
MTSRKTISRALCASLATALLVPAGAPAHDGRDGRFGRFGHHHHGVLLMGTVTSVDASASTLVVKVAKATRSGQALEGDDVSVKVVRAWVADTDNDGKHTLADVKSGDTVLVFTKRRFVDSTSNSIAAAKVFDKSSSSGAFRSAGDDDQRDGGCDHRS